MKNGYGAPYVRLMDINNSVLPYRVTGFTYSYKEEGGDTCVITLKLDSPSLVDEAPLQVHNKLKAVWGYLGGPSSAERTIYILDRVESLTGQGTSLKLLCYPRATYMKLKAAQTVRENVTVTDVGEEVSEAAGAEFVAPQKALDEDAAITGGLNRDKAYLGIDGYYKTAIDNTAVVLPDAYLYAALPQANKSDYTHVKDLAAREPGGPYDTVLRDDKLIVKKRNYSQNPIRYWNYKNEDGQLISFIYSSNNKQKMQAAVNQQMNAAKTDEKSFTAANVNSEHDGTPKLATQELGSPRSVTVPGSSEQNADNAPPSQGVDFSEDPALFSQAGDIETLDAEPLDNLGIPLSRYMTSAELSEEPNEFGDYEVLNQKIVGVELNSKAEGYLKSNGDWTVATESTAVVKIVPLDLGDSYVCTEADELLAVGEAKNRRALAAMKLHKAKAVAVGDPRIESGRIASYLNVGSKNSGNWFIDVCTHTIDFSAGYKITMQLARNAQNPSAGSSTGTAGNTITAKQGGLNINPATTEEVQELDTVEELEAYLDGPPVVCRTRTQDELDIIITIRRNIDTNIPAAEDSIKNSNLLFLAALIINTAGYLLDDIESIDEYRGIVYATEIKFRAIIGKYEKGIICDKDGSKLKEYEALLKAHQQARATIA